jgi:hypothetical protein
VIFSKNGAKKQLYYIKSAHTECLSLVIQPGGGNFDRRDSGEEEEEEEEEGAEAFYGKTFFLRIRKEE